MSRELKEYGQGVAIIEKVSTTKDNGARITLDFGADSHLLIKALLTEKLTLDNPIFCVFVEADIDE